MSLRAVSAVTRVRRRLFLTSVSLWLVFFVAPAVVGPIYQRAFDELETNTGGPLVYWLALAVLLVAVVRTIDVHFAALTWVRWWVLGESLQRYNLMRAQVASGGSEAGRATRSPAGAIAHFRDGPRDVLEYVDSWVDVTGAALFTIFAVAMMATIDPAIAIAVAVPVVLIGVVARMLGAWIHRAREADRLAVERVTETMGELLRGAAALSVHDAADRAAVISDRATAQRLRTVVRDRVLTEGFRSLSESVGALAVGLALVVTSASAAAGELTAGDFALLSTYAVFLGFLPRMVGFSVARARQAEASIEHMSQLVAGEDHDAVFAERDLPIDRADVRSPVAGRPIAVAPLERMSLRGFGSSTANGFELRDIDLDIAAGEVVIVGGQIGAGKTTLLRALLGLVPHHGDIFWNGDRIDEPGAFMVPGAVGYLPQNPQLFSDTVRRNIALDLTDTHSIDEVCATAQLTRDLAGFADGLDTTIGTGGTRLSGGQRQRVAAARAMATRPQLLVLDDLSSALDVHTELAMWKALRASGATVLAVSNRPAAHAIADRVVHLEAGRLSRNLV